MINASTIMSKQLMTINSTEDVEAALNFFMEKKVTSIPVTNPNGNVLGMLTELILARLVFQSRAAKKNDKLGLHLSALVPPQFIHKDASLADIVKSLVTSHTNRTIVQDATGKPIGMISPKDILKLFADASPSGTPGATPQSQPPTQQS
ncbi:CBS domain-containing protein [Bdellovibrionota bacterium FG-2]